MTTFAVVLSGGSPWGFRITGGREFNEPITVSKINPNSKAYNEGIKVDDIVHQINGQRTQGLNYAEAQQLIKNSTNRLQLEVSRGSKDPNIYINGGISASTPPKAQKLDTESPWSDQPAMWSKRPALPPASPKPMKQAIKPLSLYETQPVSSYGGQGSRPSSASHSQTWGPSSSVKRASSSSHDTKSPGMNLFRRQQQKLAQLGADMQEINISEPRQSSHRPYDYNFESSQVYSAQSSPGATGFYAPARSLSVDEGARHVPIIVQTSGVTRSQPFQSHRRNSENTDSFYHTRAASDQSTADYCSSLPSWQSGLPDQSHLERNFGVGSYATLPAKSSSSLHHHQATHSSDGGGSIPLTQPLSVDADQPINDFDYHIYSTLPTIKPLRSSNLREPLNLPQLEREKKFQDFSKPLWTNTDLPASGLSGRDDSHSPPSDNAVSSSDSRDTIIARSDETRSSHTDSTVKPEPRSQPMMIPVRVVHEETTETEQLWGKRVVEGADQNFSDGSSEPAASRFHEKPPELHFNGLKSPSFTSSTTTGVWSPGISPSSVKSEPVRAYTQSSPPGTSLKNIAPVWKPSGSPGGVRKEYKPVQLNLNAKTAKHRTQQENQIKPEESYAWQPSETTSSAAGESSHVPTSHLKYTPMSTASSNMLSRDSKPSVSQSAAHSRNQASHTQASTDHIPTNGTLTDNAFETSRGDELHLPATQSPYITLLQKSRGNETQGDLNINHIGDKKKPIMLQSEGQIPRGAQYLGETVTVEGDQKHTDTFFAMPTKETTTTTQTVERKPLLYQGIGPLDSEGVPLAFRKNIPEENQHDWYKHVFKKLHKKEEREDGLGINDMIDSIFEKAVKDLNKLEENKYRPTYQFPDDISDTKSEEDFKPYRPAYLKSSSVKADDSGYRSEPEGRYKDLFRRHRSTSEREPRESRRNVNPWAPASIRSKIEVYKIQPKSIMDYEPGCSSIAFEEAKRRRPRSYSAHSARDGIHKKKGSKSNQPTEKAGRLNKHSSDRAHHPSDPDKREDGDGADPRDAYKRVQLGGEIPAKGLQKPAPEKPQDLEDFAFVPQTPFCIITETLRIQIVQCLTNEEISHDIERLRDILSVCFTCLVLLGSANKEPSILNENPIVS